PQPAAGRHPGRRRDRGAPGGARRRDRRPAADDDDADRRPPCRGRRSGRRVPGHGEVDARGAGSSSLMIRRGGQQDVPFMRDMLRHAYYWRWADPELLDLPVGRYVDRWGRPGDTALVIIQRFQPVGAAWYRLFKASEPGYGFLDEQTPELTIAVGPR